MVDLGLTHVALPVSNLNDSIAFYTKYARMQVVHRRTVPARSCTWPLRVNTSDSLADPS